MKTFSPTPADIDRQWYLVDAEDQILGRLAAQIAHRLRGKHKPEFAPHMDNGDFIVVINCEKIRVTGTKMHDNSTTAIPAGLAASRKSASKSCLPPSLKKCSARPFAACCPRTVLAAPC